MPYQCLYVSFTGSIPCLFRILIYTHFFFSSYLILYVYPVPSGPRSGIGACFSSYTILYSFLNRILPYLRRPVSFLRIFYCIPLFIFSYGNIYAGIFLFVYFIVRTYGWFYVLALRRESCFSLFFSYIFLYVFLYLLRILYCMFPDPNIYVHGARYFSVFFRIPFRFLHFFFRILYCILLSFLSYLIPYVFFLRLPVSFLFCGLGMYSCRMDAVRYRGFNTGKIRMKDGRREER